MKACPHCGVEIQGDARFCGTCGRTITSTQEVSQAGVPSSSTAEAPQLIGREIAGRYRVHAKLGEGGMGAVYRAEQMSLKRTVAVKLLRPEVAGSQVLLARFNAEAQAVAKLSHPNTVNIYDFGQDSDGTLFIAMEFIEGRSLRSLIHKEAPLALTRTLHIAAQIAASLTDAHATSIVHRDLKPDNVMLQERGKQRDVVRVLDFGIAKLRDEGRATQMQMTQAGDMLGTPQYMAPEQIRAENIDGRTDVYALGCMIYEMVTGRLPFEAPTVMALLSKHLLEPVIAPSQRRPDLDIPLVIDRLVLDAMAKDAAQRPATMEQMGERIAAALAELPVDTQERTAAHVTPAPPTQPNPIVTPPAPSAFVPNLPPPPGPAPSAQHAPPAFVPTPSGYVPQSTGAPAYDPQRPYVAPAPPQVAKKNNAALWIVLGVLAVGGIGAAAYFATRGSDKPAQDDPWAGSGSAAPVPDDEPDDPVPTPTPTPAPDVVDPWSGGNAPKVTAPANAIDTVQGIKVVLPAGMTVVQQTPTQFAAADISRGMALAIATLPPGTDDLDELAEEYAQTQHLTLIKSQDALVAGKLRRVYGFQGAVNGDTALQVGTVLVGPTYRAAVIFHVQQSSLTRDPSIAKIGDELLQTGLYAP